MDPLALFIAIVKTFKLDKGKLFLIFLQIAIRILLLRFRGQDCSFIIKLCHAHIQPISNNNIPMELFINKLEINEHIFSFFPGGNTPNSITHKISPILVVRSGCRLDDILCHDIYQLIRQSLLLIIICRLIIIIG